MSRVNPRTASEWGAVAPQWLGVFGLIACFIVWLVTLLATGHGQFEPAFLTSFGGLLVLGQGVEVSRTMRRPVPPPVPDKTLEAVRGGRSESE